MIFTRFAPLSPPSWYIYTRFYTLRERVAYLREPTRQPDSAFTFKPSILWDIKPEPDITHCRNNYTERTKRDNCFLRDPAARCPQHMLISNPISSRPPTNLHSVAILHCRWQCFSIYITLSDSFSSTPLLNPIYSNPDYRKNRVQHIHYFNHLKNNLPSTYPRER